MPPARHTSAARAHQADPQVRSSPRPRPRPVTRKLPTSKVAWDRKFRLVMVAVFLLIGWVAAKTAVSVLSAHSQAASEIRLVQRYSRENHLLEREAKSLSERKTLLQDARQLGMVRPGERSYVITGMAPDGGS